MVSTFWTNTIWYILLGTVSLLELIYTIYKAENRKRVIAFFLTVMGMTLWFETPLAIFLKSYIYYPKILMNASNPFDDVLAGNIFSQFSISASLVMVTVLKFKNYWCFIFGVLYGIIEECFLALGIYRHNWYQTWMTIIMFPLLFSLTKMLYGKITRSIRPILYYVSIFLGLFPLFIVILQWSFMLTGIQDMSYNLLPDPIMSRHSLAIAQYLIFGIPIMYIYFSNILLYRKFIIAFLLLAIYYIAFIYRLVWIKEGWFLPVSILTIIWIYLSVFLHDKLYGVVKQISNGVTRYVGY